MRPVPTYQGLAPVFYGLWESLQSGFEVTPACETCYIEEKRGFGQKGAVTGMDRLFHFPNMTQTLQVTGCHFGIKPPGWRYPRHHHHLYELICCLEGESVHDINRTTLTLRPGEWLLIKSGIRHESAAAASSHYRFFNVHFDLDDAEVRSVLGAAPYSHIPSGSANRGKLPFYVQELEEMMRQYAAPDTHGDVSWHEELNPRFEDRLLLQSYTLLIVRDVLALIRERDVHAGQASSKEATLLAIDVAHAIEERLAGSFHEEATISAVAEELHLSRSQCSKLFSKVYGLSPKQYVSRRRLSLAKELLVTTNLPMTEIAERLGFQSASHFSRQFRRWTGQAPSDYKPKHDGCS